MRLLGALGAGLLMMMFGVSVYLGLGLMKSGATRAPARPQPSQILIRLDGTLYMAQAGSLYQLTGTSLTRLRTGAGDWSQPAPMGDGRLVAVSREGNFSDLYLLAPGGSTIRQLTDDRSALVETNHWAFYPAVSADDSSVYYSFDRKDPANSFRVDLSIWERSLAGGDARQLTEPTPYTGGDVQPRVGPDGGIVYTRFGVSPQSTSQSAIWFSARPGDPGTQLTDPGDNCAQPALSGDGARLAMICTSGKQSAQLVIADFDGHALANRQVLVDNQLAAGPSWSPDGRSLAYLAPAGAALHFQLWWVTPGNRPLQVTRDLNLDATSAPAWAHR